MSTRLEDALTALRARAGTAASLPTVRAWLNTALTPQGSDTWCADYVLRLDTHGIALGPNPRARTAMSWQLSIRTPKNIGAHPLLALVTDAEDVFRAGGLLYVGAEPVTLIDIRTAFPPDPTWLHAAITIDLTFDHA